MRPFNLPLPIPMSNQATCVRIAVLILLLDVSSPTTPLRAVESRYQSGIRESFKFDPDDGPILVPVRVAGRDYPFILDTGCTASVFDTSLKPHLGKRVGSAKMETPNASMRMETYSRSHVTVGSLPLNGDSVECHDFTLMREGVGCGLFGVLGLDFLNEWIVAIDFDQGRLDILSPTTQPERDWGECIRVTFKSHETRYIPGTLSKSIRTTFLAVDTGDMGSGMLNGSLFSQLVTSGDMRAISQTKTISADGVWAENVGRILRFRVRTFESPDLRFTKSHRNDVDGNALGLGYLRRFHVILDFPHERIFLKKGKHFAERDHGAMCGMCLLFKKNGILVDSVDKNCPAETAGVRAKDLIVAMCGKPVSEMKPSAINRLLRTEGESITMTLDRSGKKVEATFTLKELD